MPHAHLVCCIASLVLLNTELVRGALAAPAPATQAVSRTSTQLPRAPTSGLLNDPHVAHIPCCALLLCTPERQTTLSPILSQNLPTFFNLPSFDSKLYFLRALNFYKKGEAKARYESIFKNQQMHPEKGFTLKESNYIDFTVRIRQVAETLNWELFYEKRPSVDEDLVHEFYVNLTLSELMEVPVHGIKVPISSNAINEFFELPNFENDEYSSLMSNIEPENLQKILEELTVPETGYSQGTIIDWNLYRIAGDSVLLKRVEESGDLETEEEDPIMQSTKVLDKVAPMEPEAEPDVETSMFKAQSPPLDLRDELSNLIDIMQHMQWQQQAYWRYSKIRDDSMRSAFTKIYNDPFIFVLEFPNFIFEPWSPLSKKEKRSNSCKGNNDEAKDESNSKGSTNK
ncbi:hypothetical protein PVK06_039996 [Gossypium arboreum]|uniref:Uncharacterized protein n=1 Tax=Gossypium arboreum TaxID=29729 RepID=A0ABR0N520_GOSAR|nr:hypothetical protein PVK06_039996 [Gossypium arboreum]